MTHSMLTLMLLGIPALLAFASLRRIPEGHAYTIHRFGRPARTLSAGTHVVVPLIEKVAHKIRLFGNVVEFRHDDATGGLVYFQVLDPLRANAVIKEVDDLVRTRALGFLASSDVNSDVESRIMQIKTGLNQLLHERGILITRVQLNLS